MTPYKTLYLVYDTTSEEIVKYYSLSDAVAAAKDLAERYQARTYYVLKSIAGFTTSEPRVEELQFRDAPDIGLSRSAITQMMEESRRENS